MKKIISTVLVSILLIGSIFTLASCGGVSGTYESDTWLGYTYSLEFSSKTVKIEGKMGALSLNYEAEYKIEGKGDEKTITFIYDEGADKSLVFNGTMPYVSGSENGNKYIKIGEIRLDKK